MFQACWDNHVRVNLLRVESRTEKPGYGRVKAVHTGGIQVLIWPLEFMAWIY